MGHRIALYGPSYCTVWAIVLHCMQVWRRLLRVPEAKGREPGIYEELKSRARLLSKDIRQIDLDINRTYRNHLMFRKRYDIK